MAAFPGIQGYQPPGAGPAGKAWAVTPSDSVALTAPTQGLWVGTTGDVAVQMAGVVAASPVVFHAVPAGTFIPICVTFVLATSTTASNIVALW